MPRNARGRLAFEVLETRLVLSAAGSGVGYQQISSAWFGSPDSSSAEPRDSGTSGDRWILRLTEAAAAAASNVQGAVDLLSGLPVEIVSGLGLAGQLLVTSDGAAASTVTAALATAPEIAYFRRDASIGGSTQTPDDPRFVNGEQYGLLNTSPGGADIDAPQAWGITAGSDEVVTAVIDSGIAFDHPDLASTAWTNLGEWGTAGELANDGIDNDGNGFVDDVHGWDFINNDNDPTDDHGHGTHVAGTIAASGDDGVGVTGVNQIGTLMSLKFLGADNVGSVADAVAAIQYATMMKQSYGVNVPVINASWGGPGADDPDLRNAISLAGDAGMLFVTAAGNGDVFGRGQDIDELPFFPASFGLDNMLTVAATDRLDALTTFTNYGVETVDLAAPGQSILSTSLQGAEAGPSTPTYGVRSGTSAAAPFVSGVAALIWASSPDAPLEEVRQALLDGSDTVGGLVGKVNQGRRLNAYHALLHLPPQVRLVAAPDVTSVGATSYQFEIEISGNDILSLASIEGAELVVRRVAAPEIAFAAHYVSSTAPDADGTITATYAITPPGGAWDDLDAAVYEIYLPEEQIADAKPLGPVYAQNRALGRFVVNLTSEGVFRPDVLTDGVDANLADGVPQTVGGATTLRAAVQEANLVTSPGGGVIVLDPGVYVLTLPGAVEDDSLTGDLDITGQVTIAGNGAGTVVIDASGLDRALDVRPGGSLSLQGVTIRNGAAVLEDGGGIRNLGELTVSGSSVVDSASDLDGGGVYNDGTLVIDASTVAGNTAAGNGGGLFNEQGATASVTSSTFSDNSATGETIFAFERSGDIFRLSNSAAGGRVDPKISYNSLGEAVAVWTNQLNTDSIFAQRLNADGTRNGDEFAVHGGLPGDAQMADVALHDDGSFAVVFQYNVGSGFQDWEVGLHSFDASNQPVSAGLVTISGFAAGQQQFPRIAPADGGDYLVEWFDSAHPSGSGWDVVSRRVDSAGAGGVDRIVNSSFAGNQTPTGLTRLASGEYIAVWRDSSALDGSGNGVFARRLDSAGVPIGTQFQVNVTTAGHQNEAEVAPVGDGFAVVWWDANGIYARLYNATAVAQSGEIAVSPQPVGAGGVGLGRVSAAGLSDGTFVVTWAQVVSRGLAVNSVLYRRYDASGVPLTDEITLTTEAFLGGTGPTVRASTATDLAYALWDGNVFSGIAAQMFQLQTEPTGDGGGIANAGVLTLTNATVSGNSAIADGHGLYNRPTGSATLLHATIAENDGPAAAHGVANDTGGVVTLQSTIVARNALTTMTADLLGGFVSDGGNLIGVLGSATGVVHGQNDDQAGDGAMPLDPLLQPLGAYGGSTATQPPRAHSPAIDRGIASGAPAVDQRGVARPSDGDDDGAAVVDVGAVETFYASVSGKKFNDLNNNGLLDPGEPGLAGWVIFLDADGDGRLDDDERSAITRADDPTTTGIDEAGAYDLFQVPPGDYSVLEVAQDGWERTYAPVRYGSENTDFTTPSLVRAQEATVSPDGKHVYVLNDDASAADTLTILQRDDETGELAFVTALVSGQLDSLGTTVEGLEGRAKLAFSPDGLIAYAIADQDDRLATFDRDPETGVLTVRQTLPLPAGVSGSADVVVSSDGLNVYLLGSSGNALVVYLRLLQTTGNLVQISSLPRTGEALALPADGEHLYVADSDRLYAYDRVLINGTLPSTVQTLVAGADDAPDGGLDGMVDLAVSDDGLFVYTLAAADNAIGVFGRNPSSGQLTYFGAQSLDGLAASVDSLTISPQGDRLYVSANSTSLGGTGALVVLQRDTETGLLTYRETLEEIGPLPDAPTGLLLTLGDPGGVAVSPDGRDFYVASSAPATATGAVTHLRRDGEDFDLRRLAIADALTDVNFSNFARHGEIRGTVYDDRNNNGIRDAGELGLAGVVVYPDYDGSGTLTQGTAEETDAVATGVFGDYALAGLVAPATYEVRLEVLPSQLVTSPGTAQNRQWTIDLAPDELNTGADFLVHTQFGGVADNEIRGQVWRDDNGNGMLDGGEMPLAGRQVYLDVDDNGQFDAGIDTLANQPTDVAGNYSFPAVFNGNFAVRLLVNPGESTRTPIGNRFERQEFDTGDNPTSLIAVDFDGDDRLDLVNVNNSEDSVSIRFQDSQGSLGASQFYDVNALPTSLAAVDFNGDDLLDMAVVHWGSDSSPGTIVFLQNNGDKTFTRSPVEISIPNGRSTVVAGDFVPGGGVDLAVAVDASGANDIVRVLANNLGDSPSFAPLPDVLLGSVGPRSLAYGNLNADALPDLVVGTQMSVTVPILLNNAGASFTLQTSPIVPLGPVGVAVADVVGDANDDIIVTSALASTVVVLQGDGAGGLTPAVQVGAGDGPRTVAAGDVDGDGDEDLIVGTSVDDEVYILRNEGGTFSFAESSGLGRLGEIVASGVRTVVAADIDGNGSVDLAAIRGSSNTGSLSVLYNFAGPGAYRLQVAGSQVYDGIDFGVIASAVGPAGDYDGDGKVAGADFLTWQRELGADGSSPADGDGNGIVNSGDLAVWSQGYGDGAVVAAASVAASSSLVWEDAELSALPTAALLGESRELAGLALSAERLSGGRLLAARDAAFSEATMPEGSIRAFSSRGRHDGHVPAVRGSHLAVETADLAAIGTGDSALDSLATPGSDSVAQQSAYESFAEAMAPALGRRATSTCSN